MTTVSRTPVAVFVGAPGAGKSTIGRKVADRFMLPFVDTDELIEAKTNKKVAEIFVDDGETVFRTHEADAVDEALRTCVGIVSLGGGAVTTPATRDRLKGHRVIWLQVSAGEAAKRVGMNAARPLLIGNVRGTLQRLLADREVWYAEVATDTIETSERPVHEIVSEICDLLEAS